MTDQTFFDNIEQYTKFRAIDDYDKNEHRFKKTDNDCVFKYAFGRSRYGRYIDNKEFCNRYTIIPESLPGYVWEKNVKTIVRKLEKSKLWPNILTTFCNLQKMSYAEYRELCNKYPSIYGIKDVNQRMQKIQTELGTLVAKYPFLIENDNLDYQYCDYNGITQAQLKSMYFGHTNKMDKDEIQKAFDNKKELHLFARTSYDINFSYNPTESKAWYSEEYKDCGNGHYYLALDKNTALFCENE